MYSVDLSQKSQKFLDKLDKRMRERIEERLRNLSENQVPSDARFICRDNNDKVFRYRIGDFRALYKIKLQDKIVLITKIDKRPRVY
ncbi:type II toxin-antitoxin system RelE/ParE family toxin [Candidatus Woesearchaeota archaeon]|nr:type II toxin-antitoxin system RelE/ParE family toxin [Candidatus Woesearchaeota archaeon]